jgi:hypothetical protein
MLDKIGKTLRVVNELKAIPAEERVWLLTECKKLARERYGEAERDFHAMAGAAQYRLLVRMDTLKIVMRLLDSIHLRDTP